jgi:hypothetical protein
MKKTKTYCLAFLCGAALFAANSLFAGDAKSYQVTGPILELTPTTITVQKGDERWQLDRTSSTRIKGDLKVGAKVTIHYTMAAEDIEVKETKGKESKPKN